MSEPTTTVEEVERSGAPAALDPFGRLNSTVTNFIAENVEGDGIHAALWAAKVALPAIERNGQLTLGSNSVAFTKVDDIRKALYPFFAQFGIMAYLELVSSDETLQVAEEPWTQAQAVKSDGTVGNGGIIGNTGRPIRDGRIPTTRMWAWVEYQMRFTFILDGSQVVVGPVKGSAYDTNSDKATGKATTAAIKRILAETFDIVDEKEEDNDSNNHEDDNRAATTDRRVPQEGADRGTQARGAAAPGASARPGRPSRAKKAEEPAAPAAPVEEKPAAAPTPPAAPEPAVETPAPAAEAPVAPQQPSDEAIAAADTTTGEVVDETPAPTVQPETPPAPPTAPMPDALAAAKGRVKAANGKLGLSSAEVDAIAAQVTGIETRAEWITKGTAVAKLADALEAKVAAL